MRYRDAIRAYRRQLILEALNTYPTMRAAAKALGIAASTVTRECQRLGIRFERRIVRGKVPVA